MRKIKTWICALILATFLFVTPVQAKKKDAWKPYAHVAVSAATTAGLYTLFTWETPEEKKQNLALAVMLGIIPGFVKEQIDHSRGYEFSYEDMGYNALGVVLAASTIRLTVNF